jgi:hypothetical protein
MAITDTVKDAAFVTIGFGVLGFQKAQVWRHELTKQLETQLAETRKAAASFATQIEGYVAPVLETVESSLPPTASEFLKQARTRLGLSAA